MFLKFLKFELFKFRTVSGRNVSEHLFFRACIQVLHLNGTDPDHDEMIDVLGRWGKHFLPRTFPLQTIYYYYWNMFIKNLILPYTASWVFFFKSRLLLLIKFTFVRLWASAFDLRLWAYVKLTKNKIDEQSKCQYKYKSISLVHDSSWFFKFILSTFKFHLTLLWRIKIFALNTLCRWEQCDIRKLVG